MHRPALPDACCSPAIAAVATVLTLAMPLLAGDALAKRMKSVALEREKIRPRERARLARGEKVVAARSRRSSTCSSVVERFNLQQMASGRTKRARS